MKKFFYLLLLLYGGAAWAQLPIYVSILPQKYFIERIGGEQVDVSVMVQAGHSPATYEPTPSQMAKLSQVTLYFRIGVAFEDVWLPKLQQNNPQLIIIDARQGIELQTMPDIEEVLAEHHEDEHHEDEHHHHGAFDPHIWLNPRLVKIMAQQILQQLIKYDPTRQALYQQNHAQFVQELEQVDTEIQTILAKIEHRKFMVFHPSWGYFAQAYHLQQIPIEIKGKSPNPKDLAHLIHYAKQHKIKVIFVQKQFSQKAAQAIANSTQAQLISVDPLALNYLENLVQTAKTFAKAMQ